MLKISKIAVPGVAEPYDIGTLSIPFGQVDSTSTDTAYTAQIEGITSLYDGVCVYLKNGVITSNKNGFTLNINGLGAKPVYDTLAAATRSGTVFNVDYTMLFVYNSSRVSGGCWDIFYGYNSDTTDLEEALTPLTGTTETLTPTQVYDAIKSGKSVVLQHTHSLLGLFTFASFNIFEREKTVVSTSIGKNGGTYLVGSLAGLAGSNEWVFNITEMAEADDIPVAVNEALAQAKASGEFDGADGKSAYQYAQDGGYTGPEEEFAAKLAQEKFANPNALTFTGAVTGSYDGSAPMTVNIPSGGGGTGGGDDAFELIGEATSSGVSDNVGLTIPLDGSLYKAIIAYAYNLPAGNKKRIVIRTKKVWTTGSPLGWNSMSGVNMTNTWGFFGAAIDVDGKLFTFGAAEARTNSGHGYFRFYPQDGALPVFNLSDCKFISLDCNSPSEILPDGCSLIVWGVRK